ncbi:MAG: MerR family transcriptional regulator [Vicinamibacterales bacterium]
MNSKQPVETLTIGRLARLGGVNLETIRYYEREGLLARPPRTRSGYRIFPRDAAQRLRFIKRAQQLGFALTEIRELLALRVKQGTKRDQIRARAEAKISDIEQKIQTLTAMKRALAQLTTQCSGCGPVSECPILESLDHESEVDHG